MDQPAPGAGRGRAAVHTLRQQDITSAMSDLATRRPLPHRRRHQPAALLAAGLVLLAGAALADPMPTPSTTSPATSPAGLAAPLLLAQATTPTPVELAYRHFLDEAHAGNAGRLRVGSPQTTPGRISVPLSIDGEGLTLVAVELEREGREAVVVIGPEDAGAWRRYRLVEGPTGWQIADFEDLDL